MERYMDTRKSFAEKFKQHHREKERQGLHLRPIKNFLLLRSGLFYRVIVISVNALFFQFGVKQSLQQFGALGASLIWNTINMCLYFLYHFTFAKFFKLGK